MADRIMRLLAEDDPASAIIDDQYSAAMEKIAPGSYPSHRDLWPFFSGAVLKKLHERLRSEGLMGLGDLGAEKKEEEKKDGIDWGKIVSDVVGAASGIGTALVNAEAEKRKAKALALIEERKAQVEEAKAKQMEAERIRAEAALVKAKAEATRVSAEAEDIVRKARKEQEDAAKKAGWFTPTKIGIGAGVIAGVIVIGGVVVLALRRKR
jgi:hypothetical protein